MEITEKGLLTLLRSAITGEELPLPEGFGLEQAMELVKRHHMTALICEGARNCGLDRDSEAMKLLLHSYGKGLRLSERQLARLGALYDVFDKNGIDYMPLKGCCMKPRYPKPELRTMGDADILIRMEQYEKIVPLLEQMGFRYKTETDHELVWIHPELYLELHKRVIPSYNKDYAAYFGDGWRLAKVCQGTRYAMLPEDEFVYLFTHFAKHFRDGGIGCRHVLDLWVFLRTFPDLDEEKMLPELKRLQVDGFYRNMRRLMDVWFGDEPEDERTQVLTEYLFSSGSWGVKSSRAMARIVRDSRHSVLGFSGKALYTLETMFPPANVLWDKYRILKKAPWLLPFVWVYRIFFKLLVEPKSLGVHMDNLEHMDREELAGRQDMLRYVGLDYNF